MFGNVYAGRKVLVTGHTGFKGSWLLMWLLQLGADVAGFALEAPCDPSHFDVLNIKDRIRHYHGDVRDREGLRAVFRDFKPEFVFHLAAQALVRPSYEDPATTFETNMMGTLNVLECIRTEPGVKVGVMITSDKCYRNLEWSWGYRETDSLGGEDPYSGSKGGAELICYSYFHSFFKDRNSPALATARAGNVIGGGDWARERIVPDCVRSWSKKQPVTIRSPHATRPWQHVLEPLSGYLHLGSQLFQGNETVRLQSYNFGPDATVNQPVTKLIDQFAKYWPDACYRIDDAGHGNRPEARLLKLCCDQALADLQWRANLDFDETVRFTSQWYHEYYAAEPVDMFQVTSQQIQDYCEQARQKGLGWACE